MRKLLPSTDDLPETSTLNLPVVALANCQPGSWILAETSPGSWAEAIVSGEVSAPAQD